MYRCRLDADIPPRRLPLASLRNKLFRISLLLGYFLALRVIRENLVPLVNGPIDLVAKISHINL